MERNGMNGLYDDLFGFLKEIGSCGKIENKGKFKGKIIKIGNINVVV